MSQPRRRFLAAASTLGLAGPCVPGAIHACFPRRRGHVHTRPARGQAYPPAMAAARPPDIPASAVNCIDIVFSLSNWDEANATYSFGVPTFVTLTGQFTDEHYYTLQINDRNGVAFWIPPSLIG